MKEKTTVDGQAVPRIIISVSGGVADVLFKPRGLAVTIVDYDVEGSDESEAGVVRDPEGTLCSMGEWPATKLVIANKHWPLIRQARRSLDSSSSRLWKCPECKRTVRCSYEQLAEAGSPYCPDCESEMNLV